MSESTCEQEARILAALRAGATSPAVAEHLRHCKSCALASDAERWLLAVAGELQPSRLPSAGSLLLRAQLRARRDAAAASLHPVEIGRKLALLGGALAFVVVATRTPFFVALWSGPATPALLLLAVGAVGLAALPVWMVLRRAEA
jgi:hypothetical protein